MRTIDFQAMHTDVRVGVLYDSPLTGRALDAAVAVFAQYERALDRTNPDSELARLNRTPAWPVCVSPLLMRVVRAALDGCAATDGLVDPRVPTTTVAERRGQAGMSIAARTTPIVVADPLRMTVELPHGVTLDLDEIARVQAIDAAVAQLKHCQGFFVEAGGDVRVGGLPVGCGPWQISIADPRAPLRTLMVLKVREGAVVTAPAGRHHSRSRGVMPGATDLGAVTVVAGTATGASVLARAGLAAGSKAGLRLLEARCVAALLLLRDGRVIATRRMRPYLV